MKATQKEYGKSYHEQFLYRETVNSPRNQARLRLLLKYKQKGRLLEIGCGTGGLLRLAEFFYSVEGMDVSQYAIASIKPHFGERVQIVNIETSQVAADSYDVIVAFNILEHLEQPGDAILKMWSGLHRDGILAGSVPYNDRLVGSTVTRIGKIFDRTHISTLSPETWMHLFNRAGFRDVTLFGEVPFGRNHCCYLQGGIWPYLAFNLMFVCRK